MKLTIQERKTFGDLTKKYLQDERVRSMNHYIQHGSITTLQHCIMVAETGFLLNRRLHLGANEESLVRAALLHDFMPERRLKMHAAFLLSISRSTGQLTVICGH